MSNTHLPAALARVWDVVDVKSRLEMDLHVHLAHTILIRSWRAIDLVSVSSRHIRRARGQGEGKRTQCRSEVNWRSTRKARKDEGGWMARNQTKTADLAANHKTSRPARTERMKIRSENQGRRTAGKARPWVTEHGIC